MYTAQSSAPALQRVSIVGLGFVGLPLALAFWRNGYHVTGIDVDEAKIRQIDDGKSYINGISDVQIETAKNSATFEATTQFKPIANSDAVIVCVPTPLSPSKLPDLTYVLSASEAIAAYLQPGQLFVLESSTYPGTTEEEIIPILERGGLRAGEDFLVAYSPERINPGDGLEVTEIPKVIGGLNKVSLERALAVYSRVFRKMIPVSSLQTAEMTKLVENTQRFVNISLMNQLTPVCRELNISIWEVIQAAATKPYGFTPYYPGPGIGGHCIPVDPLYLQWLAQKRGKSVGLIDAAEQVNDAMPKYVGTRLLELARSHHPRVLVVGVTYKPNINDLRESAAVEVIRFLMESGATVDYSDPYVPELDLSGTVLKSQTLSGEAVASYDVVVVLTAHTAVDYDTLQSSARVVLDTQNVWKGGDFANVVQL